MAQVIERLDGRQVRATRVRHVRTLAYAGRSDDVDLYRVAGGELVRCISPTCDCRVVPVECDPDVDHFPGYPPGV